MTALADPFSRVHPFFWPVLWLSLRAFVAWTGKLIEEGHGYAGLRVEITWYGWIHVVYLDLSPERARFNRHMAGMEDWRDVLARAGRKVEALIADETTVSSSGAIACALRLPLPAMGVWPRVRAGTYRHAPARVGKPPPSPRASLTPASPLSGRSHPPPASGRGERSEPPDLTAAAPPRSRALVLSKSPKLAANR